MKERTLIWLLLASLVVFQGLLVFGMIPAQNNRATRQQEQIDLQRACIEALEDKTQTLADSLGIEW